LIGPISDALFDVMILGGVASRIVAAWVGNVGTGIGYNFQRAMDPAAARPVEMVRHSNLSVATALDAAGMGLEFGVFRTLLGSDLAADNPDLVPMDCPFTGEKHLAVRALKPDLAVIHAQRADVHGNAHLWGNLGITPEAVRAARQVLVTAEEIVDPAVIRSDPNRTIVPGFKTAAVVHEPFGAHPSPVMGYYGHDDDFYVEYARATRNPDDAVQWLRQWVLEPHFHSAYLDKLGRERLEALRPKNERPAAPAEFGF
jgi:glutaconate CoA-transferase subunit A